MGALFGGGGGSSSPPPPPTPLAPPPTYASQGSTSVGTAGAQRAAGGLASTIITGPEGLSKPVTTSGKKLFGE